MHPERQGMSPPGRPGTGGGEQDEIGRVIENSLGPLLQCRVKEGTTWVTCSCNSPVTVQLCFTGACPVSWWILLCRCRVRESLSRHGIAAPVSDDLVEDFARELGNVFLGHLRAMEESSTNSDFLIRCGSFPHVAVERYWLLANAADEVVGLVARTGQGVR